MKNKFITILPAVVLFAVIIGLWQFAVMQNIISRAVLPAPSDILRAVPATAVYIKKYLPHTLIETAAGFSAAFAIAVIGAVLMDKFALFERSFSPLIVFSQAIPIFALAPLFVIWLGFGYSPKVVTVILVCTFPILIGLFEGLKSAPKKYANLIQSMGGGYFDLLFHVKIPASLPSFFSGLKISAAYSFTGAVIGEWTGGDMGLGALMMKLKNTYAYDKMFVVIILICLLSLGMYFAVRAAEYISTPWSKYYFQNKSEETK